MKKILLLISCLFLTFTNAQVGINTTTPQAALDVSSTTDGMLIPRVALSNTTTATIVTPTVSELVYNTATAGDVTPGFYFWDGVKWVRLKSSADPSGGGTGWLLEGNNFIDEYNDFIGTKTNESLDFRVSNILSGRIGRPSNGSTFFGYRAGLVDDKTNNENTFIGYYSGQNTVNGQQNTALGVRSLYSNLTGSYNVAIGREALYSANTASYNIGIGFDALRTTTSGESNLGIGVNALKNVTTGSFNIGVGQNAGLSVATGTHNVAMGFSALEGGQPSTKNVAIGFQAMLLLNGLTGNDYNVAIGERAAARTNGSYNVALGFQALRRGTGNDNIAIGRSASSLNPGTSNIAIGTTAGNNNRGQQNICIGTAAVPNVTSNVSLNNIGIGQSTLNQLETGSHNIAIGRLALTNVRSGSNNIGIGDNAVVPSASGSNQIRIGNTAVTYAGVQVAWTTTSDRRWKSDIQNSNLGLDFITKIRPVSYTRNNDDIKKIEYGFIAQEIEEVLNKSNISNAGLISKDDEGMYGVRYNDLLAPMVKAIQEQQEQIKIQNELILNQDKKTSELEEVIILQKKVVEELEKRVKALETN